MEKVLSSEINGAFIETSIDSVGAEWRVIVVVSGSAVWDVTIPLATANKVLAYLAAKDLHERAVYAVSTNGGVTKGFLQAGTHFGKN